MRGIQNTERDADAEEPRDIESDLDRVLRALSREERAAFSYALAIVWAVIWAGIACVLGLAWCASNAP